MASPGLEWLCCIPNKTHYHILPNFRTTPYNISCIVSASLSICGTIYQLLPRQHSLFMRSKPDYESYLRQNRIICWLASADLLASIGILVRSAVWLAGYLPFPTKQQGDFSHLFCAISSAWIQFFYICTYFWTFCYALDVYLLVKEKPGHSCLYHSLGWVLSAFLCTAGLVPLYAKSIYNCTQSLATRLPHYLSTYIPILFVMIVNPVIYRKAFLGVKQQLRSSSEHYTDTERNVEYSVKRKFFLVMVVFYVCWIPNILNGICLILYKYIDSNFFFTLWNMMAVLNPLQAFLNSIVYRGWAGLDFRCPCFSNSLRTDVLDVQQSSLTESAEVKPLLSFHRYSDYSSR